MYRKQTKNRMKTFRAKQTEVEKDRHREVAKEKMKTFRAEQMLKKRKYIEKKLKREWKSIELRK